MIIAPRGAGLGPVLVVLASPSGDSRNLIDQGIDALLTWDRRTVDYAATRPELRARALPADRAYVLLAPSRAASPTRATAATDDPRLAALRTSLQRDVVRGDAPSDGAWWATGDQLVRCTISPASTSPLPASAPRERRLVHPLGDRLAGELAQRVVALASWDRGASDESAVLRELIPAPSDPADRPLVAAALGDSALARSLTRAADVAYLLPLPRRALDACAAWRAVVARAPWAVVDQLALVADAGPTLITGPRAPSLTVDWDNTLRVVPRTPDVRAPR
jgi:hypothetical protein